MNHIMIDIETMDTEASALVLSIGAVMFNPAGGDMIDNYYADIDWINESLGRTISPATVHWWLQQSGEARGRLTDPHSSKSKLGAALGRLTQWMGPNPVVWGNGPCFDISIMEHAYKSCGMIHPWRHSDVRCVRTIKKLVASEALIGVEREGIHHDALADAIYQARLVSAVYGILGVSE